MKKLSNYAIIILAVLILVSISMPYKSFAEERIEINEPTEEYKKWVEDHENGIINPVMPSPTTTGNMYFGDKESPINTYENGPDGYRNWIDSQDDYSISYASTSDARYDLRDSITALRDRVENQQQTGECWCFSTIKAFETNIAKAANSSALNNYSERHMEYGTVRLFSDGQNPYGYNRVQGDGGYADMGVAYLTNGMGSVTEANMPFENNENTLPLSSLSKPKDRVATGSMSFTNIKKKFTKDGSGNTTGVSYFDGSGNTLTPTQVNDIRTLIKQHIITYGSLVTHTVGNEFEFMDGTNNSNSDNYNNNTDTENVTTNHAVSIIGWDNNYSRDNFVNGHKPSANGAYIVQNSWGKNTFGGDGVLYISYEDSKVEDGLVGITGTSTRDFSGLYQTDKFDPSLNLTIYQNYAYFAVTFDRNASVTESVSKIGFWTEEATSGEIYICPNKKSTKTSDLIKVKTFTSLQPGYHRLAVTETPLTGSQFTVVIKYVSATSSSQVIVPFESDIGGLYTGIQRDAENLMSYDGTTYTTLEAATQNTATRIRTADLPVKVFTNQTGSCTVIHQQEGLDGTYTTKDTEVITGNVGATKEAPRKSYTGFGTPAAQSVTFTAAAQTITYKYPRSSYTLTVNKDPGIATATNGGNIKYGANVTLTSTAKAGYETKGFSGDYTANFTMPAKNVTVKALANPLTYTITYKLNGGTATGNPETYNVETAVTINDPTKEGYIFDGWTGTGLSEKTKGLTLPVGTTGNKEFTANYSPITYKVKFDANGGIGSMADQNMTYDTTANLTESTLTKEAAFFKHSFIILL